MELFSELYGCYYQAVKKILNHAKSGISESEMETICNDTAFAESSLYILPKLLHDDWSLLKEKDGRYYAKTKYDTPCYLTLLQQMFIKSLLKDRRIRLFLTDAQIQEATEQLKEIDPLFSFEDFRYFDQFQDGDPYEDKHYIKIFRDVHKALREHQYIDILYKNNVSMEPCLPIYLEYSAKDDKFRLYAVKVIRGTPRHSVIYNLSAIKSTRILEQNTNHAALYESLKNFTRWEKVTFLIFNERNALERCTLQFSSYEKHIQYLKADNCYECTMYYDKADEKEIVIRLLSFGPLIQVTGPDNFVGIIKKRILRQHKLLF